MAPFHGWGSTTSMRQALRDSLLFSIQFPNIPGTHFIDFGRVKYAESTLEPTSGFEHGTSTLRIQRLNHCAIEKMKKLPLL